MPALVEYYVGMKKMQGIQYTIRNVPDQLDQSLRQLAKEAGKSLNEVVLENLNRAAGLTNKPVIYDDLDDFIGSWEEDPAFNEAILAQDQIDPEMWK